MSLFGEAQWKNTCFSRSPASNTVTVRDFEIKRNSGGTETNKLRFPHKGKVFITICAVRLATNPEAEKLVSGPLCAWPNRLWMSLDRLAVEPTAWFRRTMIASSSLSNLSSIRDWNEQWLRKKRSRGKQRRERKQHKLNRKTNTNRDLNDVDFDKESQNGTHHKTKAH